MQSADTVVIGSGPGGYVAGIRLGQLGIDTVVVEQGQPGGVCLNVGCIPSKALIHAAKTFDKLRDSEALGISVATPPTIDMTRLQQWKGGIVDKLTKGVKQLLKANGARLVNGRARLRATTGGFEVVITGDTGEEVISCKKVVVATGSRPIAIPGFEVDHQRIIDSSDALGLTEVPPRLLVIGGGYIGLELGTIYAKLGSQVTVVELLDSVLAGMDQDCVRAVTRKLRKMKVELMLETRVESWRAQPEGVSVAVSGKGGEATSLEVDRVLVSVGRRPNSEELGLAELGVAIDQRGFIQVDSSLRTNVPGVYAIGDVVGGMLLAHKASKEAEVVAEVIAGRNEQVDVRAIPAVVFTDPEVATAGLTEEAAKASGRAIKVGKFPFAALGRALSVNDTDGLVKLIIDAETETILGVHIAGNGASDLIGEAVLAMEMGAVARDLSLTVHAHPTLSEALREAAAAALGEAIHILNR